MKEAELLNRAKGGLVGHIVGDTFGVPYEFFQRGSFHVSEAMQGYMSHTVPPGTWSDDTSLTLCLMESMRKMPQIDCNDIASNFLKWMQHGYLTPYGKPFGVGRTCLVAITRFYRGVDAIECGGTRFHDNGNGALMRILPLIFSKIPNEELWSKANGVVAITHRHEINKFACRFYLCYCRLIYAGCNKFEAYHLCKKEIRKYIDSGTITETMDRLLKNIHQNPVEDIRSSGYVIDTLEAALWSFLTTTNYCNCIVQSVALGGDTDTVACVAGGIAGLYYGESAIPEKWIEALVKKDFIFEQIDSFLTNTVTTH